ncbi:uncharacterized protein LOC130924404 [Corythoichthys intestinalis]|uniref:uncharacterized protein LOC130924404 n=1 Tax=Corythoichthys intestinalis TaxID=161448 RepID=UPI0025A5DAC0|nr:uncharacterized protein LOC130924404 [Corythoichthys intestinalis]
MSAPTTANTEITNGHKENFDEAKVLMSSKPLHRFVQRDPQSLGVVIMICGFAEVMMGFILISETPENSNETLGNSTYLYIPFWQGALFLISGNLSIYTTAFPSKRMVTVSLAMYVVSIFGIMVSVGYRIVCVSTNRIFRTSVTSWTYKRSVQILSIEIILCAYSVCIFVLLIFLSVVARLALKSTNTQILFQRISTPQRDTTS